MARKGATNGGREPAWHLRAPSPGPQRRLSTMAGASLAALGLLENGCVGWGRPAWAAPGRPHIVVSGAQSACAAYPRASDCVPRPASVAETLWGFRRLNGGAALRAG